MKLHLSHARLGWVLCAGLAWLSLAQAKLEFQTEKLEFKPEIGATAVNGAYQFKNTGDHPVKILKVKPTCGCTTTSLAKDTYAPGESGSIEVKMTLRADAGTQHKGVHVTTDDPDRTEINLEIIATVKRVLAVSPMMSMWKKDGEAKDQVIEVKSEIEQPVKVTGASSGSSAFTVKVETVEEGKLYHVVVHPTDMARVTTSKITIVTDYPPDKPAEYYAYARIMGPMPAVQPPPVPVDQTPAPAPTATVTPPPQPPAPGKTDAAAPPAPPAAQ